MIKFIKHYKAKEENMYCIYYKIGDESYKNISLIQEGKNIRTFLREDTFTWNEVIGFYNELDKAFVKLKFEGIMPKDIDFNWHYTANQKGGFMCYYFQNVLDFDEYGYYLQLESNSIPEKTI